MGKALVQPEALLADLSPAPARRALTEVGELVADGLVPAAAAGALARVTGMFRLRLSPEMRAASGAEGVARQFVPSAEELAVRPGELADPIGDRVHSPVPGLTHRYPDRVIVHVTQSCDVYCRFCFRRETVGQDGPLPDADLEAALDYIARTPAVREVILTGGDPLTLSARRVGTILDRLSAIAHVDVVRFHSRVPVVAPGRIDARLVDTLRAARPAVFVVVHTNHAEELTVAARAAIGRLADAGVPLLSQTVLLRGVNDRVEVLEELLRALIGLRIKPYYLHHCDLAKGTGHFRTTIGEGMALVGALAARISGIAMPAYVLDIPGGFGKVAVNRSHVTPAGPGLWQVRDRAGRLHVYHDPVRDGA